MDKLDKKLKSFFKTNDFEISDQYISTINETLAQLPDNKTVPQTTKNFKFVLATACCLLFLITGVSLAKDIDEFFQGLLGHNKGVMSAIENNFIETNSSKTIESNNVKAYIDSVLMDDYKLCISLSFELPLEYAKDNIHRIEIPNIIIYDENNNVLYKMTMKEIDFSFFNNPQINLDNFSYQTSSDIGWVSKKGNIYSFSYIINSDGFPHSKTIHVKFDELNFVDRNLLDYESPKSYVEIIQDATLFTVKGNWILNYDLSEKTYNRENYIYRIKNYEKYNYNFPEQIIVTNTASKLEFSYDLHNILQGEDISIDRDAYIKTEKEKLATSEEEHQYNGYNAYCSYTFELSTFNATPTMQLVIPLDNGNDIVLKLEKVNT